MFSQILIFVFCSCTFYVFVVFFFNDTATTEIYTLSLHDALPISKRAGWTHPLPRACPNPRSESSKDRKSTRLNSSHANISYAVFCLKKKRHPHARPCRLLRAGGLLYGHVPDSPDRRPRILRFFFSGCGDHLHLHSFPTRRSSD